MKITALTENTSCCEQIGSEHGLSLYIECSGRRILFDTGQTELFARNAEELGIDLCAVDIGIISHGHYDHGGGLKRFLELNSKAPVYISRYAFEPHYNGERYIGLDPSLAQRDRLIYTDDMCRICDGLTLYSCNGSVKLFEASDAGLSMLKEGRMIPDDFRHEQYLLIEEGGRRVLISGCSHKGILNILSWLRPDVLIGGFHFMHLPIGDELIRYAHLLDRYPTEYYTCHCTGAEQFTAMQAHMTRLHYLSAGQSITI